MRSWGRMEEQAVISNYYMRRGGSGGGEVVLLTATGVGATYSIRATVSAAPSLISPKAKNRIFPVRTNSTFFPFNVRFRSVSFFHFPFSIFAIEIIDSWCNNKRHFAPRWHFGAKWKAANFRQFHWERTDLKCRYNRAYEWKRIKVCVCVCVGLTARVYASVYVCVAFIRHNKSLSPA